MIAPRPRGGGTVATAIAVVAGGLLAPAGPAAAVSPEELLAAMDLPEDRCSFVGASGGGDQFEVVDRLGTFAPREGSEMALLATGVASALPACVDDELYLWGDEGGTTLYDLAEIRVQCTVPEDATSLSFDLLFLTREYPVHTGAEASDTARSELTSQAWNGDVVLDTDGGPLDVDADLLVVTNQVALEGTGFDCGAYGAATGWLRTVAPVHPGETLFIEWSIHDANDGTLDSAILVDGFAFGDAEVEEPVTGVPIALDYVSPKAGSLDGGDTVILYGSSFTDDTVVQVGGQPATATLRDSGRLDVVVPPGEAAGLVDVVASQQGFTTTLVGAYAYRPAEVEVTSPPTLVELTPDRGQAAGGEVITVLGDDLDPGVTVRFGDRQADVEWVDTGELRVRSPGGDAGPAEVAVCNPDGQCADPSYLFVFE